MVLPGRDGELMLLGGLNGSTSASGVFSLDTANGTLKSVGNLPVGTHDAVGSILGGRDVVFGGGSPSTVATVEGFAGASGTHMGTLPAPRSDAGLATIGDATFIVGGYDGSNADTTVLETTDGGTFRSVGSLPVPVRYPAVAAIGGKLYVFGGEAIGGSAAGHPVDDIQMIDPATHRTSVVAHLPEPLEAAAAVVLRGQIYIAGGDSTAAQTSVHGCRHNATRAAGLGLRHGRADHCPDDLGLRSADEADGGCRRPAGTGIARRGRGARFACVVGGR